MKRAALLFLIVIAVTAGVSLPALATHVEIEVSAPPHAELGATSEVTVRLTDAETGSPLADAEVVLYQTADFGGQSGKVRIAHARTNQDGLARLSWIERSSGSKSFTVEYTGSGDSSPEGAEIHVAEGPQLYRSQEGLKLPGIGVSSIIGLLVLIWGTLFVAASLVFAVVRAGRDEPEIDWTVEATAPLQRRFVFPILIGVFVVGLASTLVAVVVRNPQTHGNLGTPQGYERTPVAYLEQTSQFAGFSLADPGTIDGPDRVEDGRVSYLAHGCAACHGLDADGGVVGASLRGHDADALEAAARFGPLGMPAFDEETLTRGQIEKIAAFVGSFGGTAPAVEVRGGEVFAQFCASCHGADAGGDIGPALAGTELSVDSMVAVVTSGRDRMPAWGGTLSDAQMEAVAEYVKGLSAPAGTTVEPNPDQSEHLFVETCSGCHGVGGSGGFAPQLAGTELSAEQLTNTISEGRNAMPAFTDLTEEQVEGLVGYILGLEP